MFWGRLDQNSFSRQPNIPIDLQWGKCCDGHNAFIFDRIFLKLAGNEDRHKFSDEFDFWLDRIIHFVVTYP